jgi:pre-rRNA-processing protein TSR4
MAHHPKQGERRDEMTMTTTQQKVQLGFCVPIETKHQLTLVGHRTRRWVDWDGGQIGGCPSWLIGRPPADGPPTCPVCSQSMTYIGQLYAPKDDIEQAYHRTLYIFACPQHCQVTVLRSNLPRDNPYWPFNGDEEDVDDEDDEGEPKDNNNEVDHLNDPNTNDLLLLCVVCGFPAALPSGGVCPTQNLPFCGRKHQQLLFHHNSNHHQQEQQRGTTKSAVPYAVQQGVYTPMYELVVEEEEEEPEPLCTAALHDDDDNDDNDGDVIQDDDQQLDSDAYLEQADLNAALLGRPVDEISPLERANEAMYEKFRDRIASAREQVIRYGGGGGPLWMTAVCPDNNTIPPCDQCGQPRTFEFQLMPQLLHYLQQHNNDAAGKLPQDDNDDDGPLLTPEELEEGTSSAAETTNSTIATAPSLSSSSPSLLLLSDDRAARDIQTLFQDHQHELDWGVVAVYTCSASCSGNDGGNGGGTSYVKEYAYVQPSIAAIAYS